MNKPWEPYDEYGANSRTTLKEGLSLLIKLFVMDEKPKTFRDWIGITVLYAMGIAGIYLIVKAIMQAVTFFSGFF